MKPTREELAKIIVDLLMAYTPSGGDADDEVVVELGTDAESDAIYALRSLGLAETDPEFPQIHKLSITSN